MSNERRADLDGDIDHLSGRDIDALVFLLAGASPNLAKKLAGKNGEGERGHLVSDLQGAATQFFITQTQHERSKKAQVRRELKKLLKSASRLEERLINIEPGPLEALRWQNSRRHGRHTLPPSHRTKAQKKADTGKTLPERLIPEPIADVRSIISLIEEANTALDNPAEPTFRDTLEMPTTHIVAPHAKKTLANGGFDPQSHLIFHLAEIYRMHTKLRPRCGANKDTGLFHGPFFEFTVRFYTSLTEDQPDGWGEKVKQVLTHWRAHKKEVGEPLGR